MLNPFDNGPRSDNAAGWGFFWRCADAFHIWRERSRQWQEFEELAKSGHLDSILSEVGLSRAQLPIIMQAYPGSTRRRTQMMRWMGVDPSRVAGSQDLRAIEWRCIECRSARQCDDWLAAPKSAGAVADFCPNLDTLKRLARWQSSAAARPGKLQPAL